jgi:hypothetical protein
LTDKLSTADTNIIKKTAATIGDFDTLLRDNQKEERLASLFVENVDDTNKLYNYAVFLNTTAPDSLHVSLVQADNAILKLATGNDDSYIKVNMLPLPLTDHVKSFEGVVDGFLACFFISIAYAFIPSSLIMFLVTERENNAKH